jgi:catechol 2,3-dioxygenase-like lactoylglutathione lyase family enzyme
MLRLFAVPLALVAVIAGPAIAETAPQPPVGQASMIGVALNVANIDKELAFYTEGLGMQMKAKIPQGQKFEYILGFSADPASPSLLLMHDTAATAPASIQHGNGYSRLVVSVPDVDATAARLASQGYSPGEVREVPGGYRITIATDPEGYKLELVQHPAKK